jgi:tetratricopeptide (TPR) repeat protein
MSLTNGPPSAWSRPASADPAVVLGEALGRYLTPHRLVRLVQTLPGGSVVLKRHPRAARDPGSALQAVWTEGLASQFRARAAAVSPALLDALDQAGWGIPPNDPFGDTSAGLCTAPFAPSLRRTATAVRKRLAEEGGPPVLLTGPRGSGCSAVTALVVEDPRIQQAFPGGVHVAHGPGPGGLLDLLRDAGARIGHARLARAADLDRALADFRNLFQRKRALVVVDGVDDFRAVRRLWSGLGAPHRVLLTSEHEVPSDIPAHRLRVEPMGAELAREQFGLWGGEQARSSTSRSLANALSSRPGLVVRCGKLLGIDRPWLTPADLLSALASVAQRDDPTEFDEAVVDAGIQAAPPILSETLLALAVLPAGPAILPDDLLCTVVGAERWGAVRHRLGESGLLECVGTGRWRIPPVVGRVIRRRSAQVPQLAASARRAAIRWARRRLAECADKWSNEDALALRLQELRADRTTIVGIIGRDPLGTIDPTDVPFGLVAWLLPHAQVRTLIARSSKLAGHPWRGAAWRWLADDLLLSNRRKDAARLLSAVIQESRRTGELTECIDATLRLAKVQYDRGNLIDGRELLETAVRDAEQARDQLGEARACLALSELQDTSGERSSAVQSLWRAVALFRDGGDHAMAAEATGRLGLLARRSGQLDVAEERFRMQAALADAASDREGVAVAERRLGRLALDAGDPEKAVYWLGRALKAREEGGVSDKGIGRLLAGYAEALMATGKTKVALATARQRIEEARKNGDLTDETEAVAELARMLSTIGAREDALRLLSDALQRDRAFGDKRGEAQHLLAAGEAHDPRRLPAYSVVCFEAARRVAEEAGWREGVARALEGVAVAEASLGQLGPALRDGRGALAIYQRLGDPMATARWQVLFGGVLIAAGNAAEGRQLMSSGARALQKLGWSEAQLTALVDGGAALSLGA